MSTICDIKKRKLRKIVEEAMNTTAMKLTKKYIEMGPIPKPIKLCFDYNETDKKELVKAYNINKKYPKHDTKFRSHTAELKVSI